MGKVSILMNCFNGEKYVRQALESVFAQTYQNFEVVFVDNCSTDASAQIARSFGEKVRIVQTPHNMSLCRARVFAREYIQGDYFCVLDIDDLMLPTKLAEQVAVLESRPEVGLVYSDTVYFKDSGEEVLAYGDKPMPQGRVFKELLANYFLSLETVMMRMSVLKQHDLYFSGAYNVSSDMELFVKLAYYTDFHYIAKPLAKWRHGHVTESINQYESFPREYEQLLSDLKGMIPNFEEDYHAQIRSVRGVVNNMFGMSAWKKGERRRAADFFKRASAYGKKYYLHYFLALLMSYDLYKRARSLLRKV